MGLREILSSFRLVALDTNIFIYTFEQHPAYWETAKAIFECIENGEVQGVASTLSLTEILTKPIQQENYILEIDYRALFSHFPNLHVVHVDLGVAERAGYLRAKHGFRMPDAINLATAIEAGAKAFITNDDRLAQIEEIKIFSITELMKNNKLI